MFISNFQKRHKSYKINNQNKAIKLKDKLQTILLLPSEQHTVPSSLHLLAEHKHLP